MVEVFQTWPPVRIPIFPKPVESANHPIQKDGDNIALYVRGKAVLEGGTSAASPIFASLVNRIVEERIRAGKGPVGFINPVLYQNPQVLNDITNGTNPGCEYNRL